MVHFLLPVILTFTVTNAMAQENEKLREYPSEISNLEKRISDLEKREKYRSQCIQSYDFKRLFNVAALLWIKDFEESIDKLKKCISGGN